MNKSKRGFTLVEVIVTIAILGVITLVALPIISNVQGTLRSSRLQVHRNAISSATKLFMDSNQEDYFGNQNSGCVDIKYLELVDANLLDPIDFSDFTEVNPDNIFTRVTKANDTFDYVVYLTETEINGAGSSCDGSIDESGPNIVLTPDGNSSPNKSIQVTIRISDDYGLGANQKIKYKWINESNATIDSEKTHDFGNPMTNNNSPLSFTVETPNDVTGNIRLVVTPVNVVDSLGNHTTMSKTSAPFVLDNTGPNIVLEIYKLNGSSKTGNSLLTKKTIYGDTEASITTWQNYGYYFDFSGSSDTSGIDRQEWKWNETKNVNLVKNYAGGSTTNFSVTDKTFSGRGARYGTVTMYDKLNNKTSMNIIVYISTTYTIKYAGNGNTGGSTANTTCYYGINCTLRSNGFSRTGYKFNNWKIGSTNYNAGATVKNLSTTDGATVTATAQWSGNSYTIKYAGNGNTGGSTANTTCKYGSNCTLKTNGFSKTGYHFTGWKIGSTNYNAGATVKNLTSSSGGTVTATAQWAANTYTIKYAGNRNTGGSTANTTCTYGSNCTLRANGFTRTNYNFTGWKIGGTNYSARATVKNLTSTNGGTVTATAQWTLKKYTISYNANGGSGAPGSQTKTHGTAITLRGTRPSRSGYTFVGWGTSSTTHTASYQPGNSYSGNSNVTLYAIWKKTITITFNRNKAAWMGNSSKSCTMWNSDSGCSITSPSIPNLGGKNKTGDSYSSILDVKGWSTSSGATSSSWGANTSKKVSSNATYYTVINLKLLNRNVRVTSDTGLIQRNSPCSGSKVGVTHYQSYLRTTGSNTDWKYCNADNPIWIRAWFNGNGVCWDNNDRYSSSACNGWSSTRYMDW